MNIFLIKGGKKLLPEHKLWVRFLEIKFFLTLLLTPLLSIILNYVTDSKEEADNLAIVIRFYLCLFIYVFSVYVKYFREVSCNNFEDDVILEKVKELQLKYKKGESLSTEEFRKSKGKVES